MEKNIAMEKDKYAYYECCDLNCRSNPLNEMVSVKYQPYKEHEIPKCNTCDNPMEIMMSNIQE